MKSQQEESHYKLLCIKEVKEHKNQEANRRIV